MNKALEMVQRAAKYEQYRTKQKYLKSRNTLRREYLKRTRRARLLRRQKLIFKEIQNLINEKRRIVLKVLKRKQLTEAEEKRIPILFRPNELTKMREKNTKFNEMEEKDRQMEEILARVQKGTIGLRDIFFTQSYFGKEYSNTGSKYSKFLIIAYNDRMTAENHLELKFDEDRSTQALRRSLARSEKKTRQE